MRKDMAKVIVERPRIARYAKLKGRLRNGLDAEPNKQGMRYRVSDRKMLNENLAPLRRYLARQVGRPWAKVYAEISTHLKATSAVQQHVRDHLKDFVALKVSVNKAGKQMLDHRGSDIYRFYVDPNDGILKRVKSDTEKARKRAKERRRHKIAQAQADADKIILAPGLELRRLNGIWFLLKYLVSGDGTEIIRKKRQLSTKELHRRGLVNQLI